MSENPLKVFSGKCCLCDVGIPVGAKDRFGKALYTGDIVTVWSGDYIGTDAEIWRGGDSLTVVVVDQYQSFSDGNIEVIDAPGDPYVMGIQICGFKSPEWQIHLVKKFSDVVAGEHWPEYGFSYQMCAEADGARIAARQGYRGTSMTGLYERIKSLEPTVGGGGQYGDGYRDALRAAATLALMQDVLVVDLVETQRRADCYDDLLAALSRAALTIGWKFGEQSAEYRDAISAIAAANTKTTGAQA